MGSALKSLQDEILEKWLIHDGYWLTRANRILRLYISTETPTSNLQMLTAFIVQVYAPVWFDIKTKPSCKDGARHLWRTVHLSRSSPIEVKTVIDPVIQRNSYFGHPDSRKSVTGNVN